MPQETRQKRAIERIMISEEFEERQGGRSSSRSGSKAKSSACWRLSEAGRFCRCRHPRPQGGLRRRPGAEHGRHGRLLSGAEGHPELLQDHRSQVFVPAVHCMKRARLPFKGCSTAASC